MSAEEVLVQSTGIIGVQLDMEKIENGIEKVVENLSEDGGIDAATAIMTTDTFVKQICLEIEIAGKKAKVAGMCKGSGMIHPNMATMLSFTVTDVNIEKSLLQKMFSEIADNTFNMISVDGDTSTNDMACVLANGLAGNEKIVDENSAGYEEFKKALYKVNEELAKLIAKDGEGATKLLQQMEQKRWKMRKKFQNQLSLQVFLKRQFLVATQIGEEFCVRLDIQKLI